MHACATAARSTRPRRAARHAYQTAVTKAKEPADLQEAARVWLREIDQLNRQLALADRRSEDVVRRANELERALPGIELAADVARIAAEAAQEACLAARRRLAACEEEAQQRIDAGGRPVGASAVGGQARWPPARRAACARSSLVLRGDRQTLLVDLAACWQRRLASRPAGFSCCCSSCVRRLRLGRSRNRLCASPTTIRSGASCPPPAAVSWPPAWRRWATRSMAAVGGRTAACRRYASWPWRCRDVGLDPRSLRAAVRPGGDRPAVEGHDCRSRGIPGHARAEP